METIKVEPEDGWVSIVLNRPHAKNALSGKLLRELEAALWDADDDTSVHAVMISGEGDSFCAGYDLLEYREKDESGKRQGVKYRGARSYDDDVWQLEKNQRRLLTAFDMHKPVVAKVHGYCVAGGIDLALACDMIVAADDARIGFPPARSQGTLPNNFWIYHVSPQWAKRLLLTGDFISDPPEGGITGGLMAQLDRTGPCVEKPAAERSAVGEAVDPAGVAQEDVPGVPVVHEMSL